MLKGVLAAGAVGGSILLLGQPAFADEVQVEIHTVDARGVGPVIGSVKAYDTPAGLRLEVALRGMLPGTHEFYVDDGNACDPALNGSGTLVAASAGGQRHRATLPPIHVMTDEDGALPYRSALTATGLTVAEIRGGTLSIVGSAENYREQPRPVAGAGKRVACGAVAP